MPEKYLTLTEVMERLQIGKSTVYRRIKDGTIPQPLKIGRLQRFQESDFDAAMATLSHDVAEDRGGSK